MPASKFTREQDAHIAKYYPECIEQAENNSSGLSKWKKDTANIIAGSSLFKGLLPDASSGGVDPDKWIQVRAPCRCEDSNH